MIVGELGGEVGVERGHQQVGGHDGADLPGGEQCAIRGQLNVFNLLACAVDDGKARVRVDGGGAKAGEVLQRADDAVVLHAGQVGASVGGDGLGVGPEVAAAEVWPADELHVDIGGEVDVEAERGQVARDLRALARGVAGGA